ncbi:MAG: hypothetical protein ACREBW_02375, partial [Candidatus Micrarchaeaceae archaeon]
MAIKTTTAPFILVLVGGIVVLLFALVLIGEAALLSTLVGPLPNAGAGGVQGALASNLSSVGGSVAAQGYTEGTIGVIAGIVMIASAILLREGNKSRVMM